MRIFTPSKASGWLILTLFLLLRIPCQSQISQWLTDISPSINLDSAFGARISIVDINNDNFPDLLWGTGNAGKNQFHLYLNTPNPDISSSIKRIYKDITEESGINVNRDPNKKGRVVDVAAMADVNNDGYVDLVTSIYYHRLEYYKDSLDPGDRSEVLLNDGTGHFTLVQNSGLNTINVINSYPAGLINATGMCFLDYDYDGKIDIYIPTWYGDRANGIGMPDVLLKGNGDGTFTQVKLPIIEQNFYPMYGANVTDWDNDGWQDVLTSPYCNSRGNLFRNMHDGTFQDYAVQANYNAQDKTGDNGQALCQWEAQPGDYDNDGNMDILQVLVHGGLDQGEGRTHVSHNNGPDSGFKFTPMLDMLKRDEPTNSHLGDQGGQWIDIDSDGNLDVAIGQMAYPQANTQGQERLYILQRNGDIFKDISKDLGIFNTIKEAHSMEPLDFDLDGDQDLLVSHQKRDTTYRDTVIDGKTQKIAIPNAYMRIRLLHNNRQSSLENRENKWLSVKLDPPAGCNRSSIGSRIIVYSGTKKYMQEVQAGLGHFAGQQQFIRFFGLGKIDKIDSVTVRWPRKDLKVTTLKQVPFNTIIYVDTTGIKGLISPTTSKKAVIAMYPQELKFDTVRVGTSKEMKFKIYNYGDTTLNVSSIGSGSAFTITSPSLPINVEPGENNSKEITMKFTPLVRKDYSSPCSILSNAYNYPVLFQPIAKTTAFGFIEQPMISVTKSIDFDTVYSDTSKVLDAEIENTGELPLHITTIIMAIFNGQFTFAPNIGPTTIQAGQKLIIPIKFESAFEGKFVNSISIISDGYNEQTSNIDLIGYSEIRKPRIAMTPTMILFGNVDIGKNSEKSIQLRNDGTGTLIIDRLTFENAFENIYTFKDFSLPFSIPAKGSAKINIEFKPITIMSYKTNVFVHSNSFTDSTFKLTFTGSGREPNSVNDDDFTNGYLIGIAPNPASDNVVIMMKNQSGRYSIQIIDLLGNTLLKLVDGQLPDGENRYIFESAKYGNGIYFLSVQNSYGRKIYPIVITK